MKAKLSLSMKVLVIGIFSFLTVAFNNGCSTFLSRQPSSFGSERILLSLDAHVHIASGSGYEGALNNPFLGHSFLISNSYSINSPKDFSNRPVFDKEVSQIVSNFPLKFSGLCGLNLSWPDAAETLTQCLSLPGMVGAKIHDLAEPEGLTEKNKFKALREVLEMANSRHLVFLWHIKSDSSLDKKRLERYLKQILEHAIKNKNIYFILAHAIDSLDSTSHLQLMVDLMGSMKVRPENLFIELSGTMDICENEPQKEKVRLWESFGFDNVLLGSDSSSRSWPGQALLEEELSVIKNSPVPHSDKKKILIGNGLKILKHVNLNAYHQINEKISETPFDVNEINTHSCESLKSLVQKLFKFK